VSCLRRILFNAATVLSLLLTVAAVALWVRSSRGLSDTLTLRHGPDERVLYTHKGKLYLRADEDWPDLLDTTWGTEYERGVLGIGTSGHFFTRYTPDMGRFSAQYARWWYIPLWFPCVVFGLLPAGRLAGGVLRSRTVRACRCISCGYDCRATPERCPECGREKPVGPPARRH